MIDLTQAIEPRSSMIFNYIKNYNSEYIKESLLQTIKEGFRNSNFRWLIRELAQVNYPEFYIKENTTIIKDFLNKFKEFTLKSLSNIPSEFQTQNLNKILTIIHNYKQDLNDT